MEKEVFIYTLSDPRFDEPRYVGKAKNKQTRLRSHIIESKKGINTYKCRWIRTILKEGIKPKIEILDIVSESEWKFWEIYWIAQMKAWGMRLTNGTLGGDGVESKYKPINQYDLKGNFIKRWISIKEASEILNICKASIIGVCRNKHRTCGNYIFKYEGDKLNLEDHKRGGKRNIIQYDLKGNFIKEWNTIIEASKELKIFATLISQCCRKKSRSTHGYIFNYKEDKLNLDEYIGNKNKPVIQYSLNGDFIKEWDNMRKAEIELNIGYGGIHHCCNKKSRLKTIGGFIWEYKGEKLNLKEHIIDYREKPIIQYDLDDNKIEEWKTITSASNALGTHITNISLVCRKITKTFGGFKWKYANEKVN